VGNASLPNSTAAGTTPRQVRGPFAFKDTANIVTGLAIHVDDVVAVSDRK